MELERLQRVGHLGNGLLYGLAMLADLRLAAWLDLGDDGEAIAGGGARKDRAVAAVLAFEITLLGNRHRGRLGEILYGHEILPRPRGRYRNLALICGDGRRRPCDFPLGFRPTASPVFFTTPPEGNRIT